MSAVFNNFKASLLKGSFNFDPSQASYLTLANGLGNTYFMLVDNAQKSNIDFYGDNTYGTLSSALVKTGDGGGSVNAPPQLFKNLKGETGAAITAADLVISSATDSPKVGLSTAAPFFLTYDTSYVGGVEVGGVMLFQDIDGSAAGTAAGGVITPAPGDLALVFYSFASSFVINGTQSRKIPLATPFLNLDKCA